MKVLPLRGLNSMRALNAFYALMLGLKMLPMYMEEELEPFMARIQAMSEKDQEKMIREAALLVPPDHDELRALLRFCTDANGVEFSDQNINNLNPGEIHECIVAVCKEIAKIKIDMIGESEKKN